MKIIQFSSGDLWAGAEVQLYHMVCSMNNLEDIDLTVILLNHGQLEKKLIRQNIKVVVLDESQFNSIKIFFMFKALVKELKPDLIHTHRTKENILGGIAAFVSGCKSVRTVHGANEFKVSLYNIKAFSYALADKLVGRFLQNRIIVVSDELKCKLSNEYPVTHLTVIKNSVSAKYIEDQATARLDSISEPDQLNVCFIGRFVPVKRIDLFYNVAKEVIKSRKGLNVHFHMIGDGPLWRDYHNRVSTDNLESRIHLTGFVKNTAPYLKKMDLLLFTSDHEGLPMTLLEAMILGVPVLARNNLKTIRQVLREGECGYIKSFDNIKAAAVSLVDILTDNIDREKKVELAKKTIHTEYLIEKNIKLYIKLYRETLAL